MHTIVHPDRLKLLKNHIPYFFRPGTLLNIGANRVRFELLDELIKAKKQITLLEAFPENAEHWRGDPRLHEVVRGDARHIDRMDVGTFDTVLWWHGPEHIERADLPATLEKLEQVAEGLMVLGCPWGKYPQGEFMGNPFDAHRASLYARDFAELGYRVATMGEADRQGSLIAWKYMRPKNPGPQIPHIVMVTHGERETFLQRTIPAVMFGTTWPLTLTVMANGPDTAALKYLKAAKGDLYKLITYKRNQGKPKAANRGWKLRDADYTVLLDDDALALEPDWLRKLVDIIDHCPQVGIVGHSVESTDWPLEIVGAEGVHRTVQVQPGNLGGACILVPRRTVELCGYYNEELPPYGETDGLYGWKVRQAGLLCAYFDHTNLGRSFEHLGGNKAAEYQDWQDKQRKQALAIEAQLIKEYESGQRPLNQ